MNVTLFVVLLPMLLGVVGLSADGGQVLIARREAQALADSAAHAGAAEIDTAAARLDASVPPPLDPRTAETAAANYIAVQEPGMAATVQADTQQVVVHLVGRPIPMTFLRLVGIESVRVTADASAEPRTGIVGPQR